MNYILDEHGIHDNDLSAEEMFWSIFLGIKDDEMEVPIATMESLAGGDGFIFLRAGYSFEDLSRFLPTVEGVAFDTVPLHRNAHGTRPGKVIAVRSITYGSYFTVQGLCLDKSYIDSLLRKKIIGEVLETL